MATKSSAGGAAAAGGIDFQARVAAWVAVRILAERDASPPWLLPAGATLEWLRCETEEPVDDLLIATSEDGFAYAQVKHSIDLTKAADSELASVLDQFVRQFLSNRTAGPNARKWQRLLDPLRDRLILILGPSAAGTIRLHLARVLTKVRKLVSGQSLADAAGNEKEERALSVIREHIHTSWRTVLGTEPSEEEVRQILSLTYIDMLDVNEGGVNEREGKDRLRSIVLQDPKEADAAWTLLVSFCTRLARARSGADRAALQQELLGAGVGLQADRSYRGDIQRLQEYTSRITSILGDLALIRIGDHEIKIDRRSTHELQREVENGSLLVVGDPGAGKSGALHDLVEELAKERDTIFLAVDRLPAEGSGELRAELGLEHDLVDVIANWPGTEPGFLIIDALDAARAEPAAMALRDLIRNVVRQDGRWRVVASIRKFDLRYSPELRELFRGTPHSESQDPEFRSIRHLNVPKLQQDELAQVEPQSPELFSLVRNAPPELRELVSVPFNLRLIADLLGDGLELAQLTPVRTQLELLDRYWQHRVIRKDGQRDAREGTLRRACDAMVQNRRLRVDRVTIGDTATSLLLHDILKQNVLAEWQPSPTAAPDSYVLTFSHHVLFDYAVERLLLRGEPATLVRRLAQDRELAIVVRPSLVLHFEHLWAHDPEHEGFWEVVLRIIQEGQIPEIGKLIGPAVGARLVKLLADLEPLMVALGSIQEPQRGAATGTLRHLIGALLAAPEEGRPLIGPGAGPWCELLERTSRNLVSELAYTMRPLLFHVCQSPEDFTPDQRSSAGLAARRLLEFAWKQSPRDSRLVIHGIGCVARTFESDAVASALLIHRILDKQHIAQFGFEELPWLAREAKRLVILDPDLVEDIYRATFAHKEESRESTALIESRILGMISHRSQDYAMALYELSQVFPDFLLQSPVHAARALIGVMESFVAQEYKRGRIIEDDFYFNGRRALIRSDHSYIWDAREGRSHEHAVKILDTLEKHLGSLTTVEKDLEALSTIITVIVKENRLACVWRRLLRLGARWPGTIGLELLPLASAKPVLTFIDTSYLAGEYIKAIFPMLSIDDRKVIERAILEIPSVATDKEREEHVRDQLLGCLPTSALVTHEARELVESMQHGGGTPTNIPPFVAGEVMRTPIRDLLEANVSLDSEANRKILEISKQVEEFANRHRNQALSDEDVIDIVPAIRNLAEVLSLPKTADMHPKLYESAWDHLAEACTKIAEADGFSCGGEVGALVYSILLEGSHHPEPVHNPEDDAQFDKSQSWGRPAPRVEAAQGLIKLAGVADCITNVLSTEIVRLSRDPVPAVRLQIAVGLTGLYRSAPDLMWEVLERLCLEDSSAGVLKFVIQSPLHSLAGLHTDRVTVLAKQIFDRIQKGPGAQAVREECISLFGRLYMWLGEDTCREIVLGIAMDPVQFPDEANNLLNDIRDALTHGRVGSTTLEEDAVRHRTWDLITRLFGSARESLNGLLAAHVSVPFDKRPEEEREAIRSLTRLIDQVGSEIYFASGAYDRETPGNEAPVLASSERERFYREAAPILDKLADIGLASLSHHLLKTLESFISFDPIGVFLKIARVVRSGQKGGYQYESLAADLLVKLVERYLAEYRSVLRENEETRAALLEILDVFVQAGWPSARRLTYHLEEIFR